MVSGMAVPQGTRLNPRRTFEVCEGMSVQAAINAAAAQLPAPSATDPWTILIYPGIYDEAITMAPWVNLKGIGPAGSVVISQVDANILILAGNVQLQNLTLRLITPTAARDLILDNGVARTALMIDLVLEITTPGIFAHIVFHFSGAGNYTIKRCSYSIGGTGALAGIRNNVAAATLHLVGNDFSFTNTNANHIVTDQAGTWTGGGNRWAGTCNMFSVTLGTILFDGDRVDCSGGSAITGGSVCIKNGQQEYHVWAGMIIQHAITAAAADTPAPAATAPYTVLIHPGIYDESIAMSSWVHLKGIGPRGAVVISQTDVTRLVTLADNIEIQNLIVRMVTPAGNRRLMSDNLVACTVRIVDVDVEVTNPAARNMVIFGFDAAGDYTLERCRYNIDGTGTSVGIIQQSAAATIHLTNNDFQFQNANATHINSTQGGTWTGGGNRWAGTCRMWAVTNGTFLLNNDSITCTAGAFGDISGGSVTLKNAMQQYEVVWPMTIQHAITAAAADTPAPAATAPYTVYIHPGIYDEIVTCASWVNLKGIGPKGSVVIYQNDANVITLADNVQLQSFTTRLGTLTGTRHLIQDNDVACTARMSDLHFEVTIPGAQTVYVFRFTAAGTYTIERCSYSIGGTGPSRGVANLGVAATIHLINNDFEFTDANAHYIRSNVAGAWTSNGNKWAGTCGMFNVTAGTFTFDNDAMICTVAWINTGSTMTLRHCAIEAPVVAGNLATVRLKNCSYRAIQRTGTGNIVDESPWLSDAPWKVHKWNWMTALANMDVGVRGTPIDAGSGQILLEVTDNVAGQEAVETNPEAAGSLANELTPARTPRFITQVVVDSFDPHVTMFFGLRATRGNAVPGMGEDHAGFIWNGAMFAASSSDGGGVGSQILLATPSTNEQHQLGVIVFGGQRVEFYVDGDFRFVVAAIGIPDATLDWQHLLATAGGGGGDEIDVTVRNGGVQECPA